MVQQPMDWGYNLRYIHSPWGAEDIGLRRAKLQLPRVHERCDGTGSIRYVYQALQPRWILIADSHGMEHQAPAKLSGQPLHDCGRGAHLRPVH
jgi:hypothetical protein